jgi:hypothetical protein
MRDGSGPAVAPGARRWIDDPRAVPVAIALLGIGFLLLGALLPPKDVFFSCDGGSKYILTRAFLQHDPAWPFLPYPGRLLDPAADYFPIRGFFTIRFGENYFSAFPVYFPMLSAPGYALFGFRGLFLLPWACGVLSLGLFARLGSLLNWSARRRLIGVLLLSAATPLGFYACTFWEHVPAVALILAGIVVLFGGEGWEGSHRRRLIAGALLGLSGFLRLEAVWIGGALVAALALTHGLRSAGERRRLAAVALGFGGALLLLAGANTSVYGSPFGTQIVANVLHTAQPRAQVLQRLVAGTSAPVWCTGVALAILAAGVMRGRHARVLRLGLCAGLVYPIVRMLLTETIPPHGYRSLIGVLEGTPFLFLLPLVGDRSGRGQPAAERAVLLGRIAALSLVAVILTSPVDGGLQGGSRLLLPSAVMALAAVLTRLSEAHRPTRSDRWHRAVLVALLLVSIPLSSRALPHLLYRKSKVDHPALVEMRRLPGEIVVLTNSYMTQGLAAAYWDRPMYQVWNEASLAGLLDRLAAEGGEEALMVSILRMPTPVRLPESTAEPARWVRTEQRRVTEYQFDLYRRAP